MADPYASGGTTSNQGGDGTFSEGATAVGFPSTPSAALTDIGLVMSYNLSVDNLRDFASFLWSLNPTTALIKLLYGDALNAVLGLTIIPYSFVAAELAASDIHLGSMPTYISSNKIIPSYVTVDCGSVTVDKYTGSFLDYEPYTKASIYLPYIGMKNVSINDIMGKTLYLKYTIEVLTGSCVAHLMCGDTVLYEWSGQCAARIPITNLNWNNTVNSVISIAANTISLIASEGGTAATAIPSIVSSALNAAPSTDRVSNLSSNIGMMGVQTPYLIITRTRQAVGADQNALIGYPSHITATLSSLSGYTEVEEVHLTGLSATADEQAEIEQLLKSGVII